MESNNIFLIGGTGRSGTGILLKILSKHPDIANVPENRFLVDPDGIIDFYASISETWSPYIYDCKLKRLEKLFKDISREHIFINFFKLINYNKIFNFLPFKFTPRYHPIKSLSYCPEFKRHYKDLIFQLTEFKFKGYWIGSKMFSKTEQKYAYNNKEALKNIFAVFLQQLIQSTLEHQKTKYYLEKNTWNILFFDKILDLLPNAKIVHIYRDPRDVVSSFMRQLWMPNEPGKAAWIYRDIIARWNLIKSKVHSGSFLEISLEDLVKETENTMRKICGFWRLPWNDKLLEIRLHKAHTGRWLKDIPEIQRYKINEMLYETIKSLGYEI